VAQIGEEWINSVPAPRALASSTQLSSTSTPAPSFGSIQLQSPVDGVKAGAWREVNAKSSRTRLNVNVQSHSAETQLPRARQRLAKFHDQLHVELHFHLHASTRMFTS
jgi:hypothetical protein